MRHGTSGSSAPCRPRHRQHFVLRPRSFAGPALPIARTATLRLLLSLTARTLAAVRAVDPVTPRSPYGIARAARRSPSRAWRIGIAAILSVTGAWAAPVTAQTGRDAPSAAPSASAALESFRIADRDPASEVKCGAWAAYRPAQVAELTLRRIEIDADGMDAGSTALRRLGPLHVTSRPGSIRRLFGIDERRPVDTLAVAAGLRRLEASKLYRAITIESRTCIPSTPSVDVTGTQAELRVHTIDAWSAAVTVRATSGAPLSVMLLEHNLAGTGRSLGVGVAAAGRHVGMSVTGRDATIARGHAIAAARYNTYADGRGWRATLDSRAAAPLPPWTLNVEAVSSRRIQPRDSALVVQPHAPDSAAAVGVTTPTLDSLYLPIHEGYSLTHDVRSVVIGRRIAGGRARALYVYAGLEGVHDELHVAPEAEVIGPQDVSRSFTGRLLGVGLHSASYVGVPWLNPGGGVVMVPVGLEGEAVVSRGVNRETDRRIAHLDAWIGRVSMPFGGRVILLTDAWASGYQEADTVSDAAVRGDAQLLVAARNGLWSLQLAHEQIENPDPDSHALTSVDPIRQVVSPRSQLAEAATVFEAERDFDLGCHVMHRMIGAAPFVAWAIHKGTLDPNYDDPTDLNALVIGVGLRLRGSNPYDAPVRVDIGEPIRRTLDEPRRWYIGVQLGTTLNANRHRLGWGG